MTDAASRVQAQVGDDAKVGVRDEVSEDGSSVRGRIFLVGVPRSGTTLLQALLGAHEAVTSFTESHLFSRPFQRLPLVGTVLTGDPGTQLATFLAENDLHELPAARWFGPPAPLSLRFKPFRPLRTKSVARRLVHLLDAAASGRDASVWLEKTPRHLRAIERIEAACEGETTTHFVHLIRRGLPTVASLRSASRSWGQPYSLKECIQRWNQDLAISYEWVARARQQAGNSAGRSPMHLLVRYEDLTASPERVLRALTGALELPWSDAMLTGYQQAAGALATAEEPWKAGTARPITPSDTSTIELTPAERTRAVQMLEQERYAQLSEYALGRQAR